MVVVESGDYVSEQFLGIILHVVVIAQHQEFMAVKRHTQNTKGEAFQLVSVDWSIFQCFWGHVHSCTWAQSKGGEVGGAVVYIIKLHHSKICHFGLLPAISNTLLLDRSRWTMPLEWR